MKVEQIELSRKPAISYLSQKQELRHTM